MTATADAAALSRDLLKQFRPDASWMQETEGFYHAVFNGQKPQRLLCGLPATPVPGHELSRFHLAEQFHHPQAMFYEHLRGMAAIAHTGRGMVLPRLRANLGTGFVATVFGIEQQIFEDIMPWPQGHLSKQQICRLEPDQFDEVSDKGLVPYALEIYEYYAQQLGTQRFSFLPDTQGVLDIAHLVRGDEIFLDPYDDPAFMHHLMECCLHAYVAVSKLIKARINEPLTSGNHAGMCMTNGGVRYCMDTSVICSPQILSEYEVPYLRRALQEFGGGWIHFCGSAPHLLDLLCKVPEVRAVNPNYMVNQSYDYAGDIAQLQAAGKAFIGAPFKHSDETLQAYFRRVLMPFKQPAGIIFQPRGDGLDLYDADRLEQEWEQAVAQRWQ